MHNNNCNLCYIRQFAPSSGGKNIRNLSVFQNGVVKPPMGWSSWNCFRNNIDQQQILEIGNALVASGLAELGYISLNLDDNWHSSMRDANGELQGDLDRFPMGISALIKALNKKGLKVGLYSSNGTLTCEDLPACFGNEERDALMIARFGAEFFKYDFCHHHPYTHKAPLISTISLIRQDDSAQKITISAADGELGGKARKVEDKKMPCGSYVKGLNKNGGIIIFDGIEAEDGLYALTLTTKKRGKYEKFCAVEVNDCEALLLTIPSCYKFNNTARVQCIVTLKKGRNIIKLYNPICRKSDGYILQYRNMGRMLQKAAKQVALENNTPEKPITYSICEWGRNRPWEWGKSAGNQWRTTPDIRPRWRWMMYIYNKTVSLYSYSDKGHYNDPDMLEVGNGKLNYQQNKSHFNLWCMMNAPLILGNDIRKFIRTDGSVDTENEVLKIITNKNMIAVNQDEKSLAAKRVLHGSFDVLAKPLSDGTAICLFNRSGRVKQAKFDLNSLCADDYVKLQKQPEYEAIDLWTNESIKTSGKLETKLPPYGSVVFKIK